MIKPDLICVWPRHMDYPLFRYNLRRFQNYFNEIHIAFSDHKDVDDYTDFLTDSLLLNRSVHFVYTPTDTGDWRNRCINDVLQNKSKAEWILFIEQDFLIKDNYFFDKLLIPRGKAVIYKEGDRLHPACALVRREDVYKTEMDFGAKNGLDHFVLFFNQLIEVIRHDYSRLDALVRDGIDFYHMAGLTCNYQFAKERKPLYKPDEFLTYIERCMYVPVIQRAKWIGQHSTIMEHYGMAHNKLINTFFP